MKTSFVTPSPRQPLALAQTTNNSRPAAVGVQPASLRAIHWITITLGVLLVLFAIARIAVVATVGRSAAAETDAAAALLHLPNEVAFILKIVAVLAILSAASPLIWAFGLSIIGKRIRWKAPLVRGIATLVAFFFLKAGIMGLTGLAADAEPARVVEIDPRKSDLFDPVDGSPRAGYVEEPGAGIRFYNRKKGRRPSDNQQIRPVTGEIVGRWKAELRAAEAERKERAAEEARIRTLQEQAAQRKQQERADAERRRQSQIKAEQESLRIARAEAEKQRQRLAQVQSEIDRANSLRLQAEQERAEAERRREAAEEERKQWAYEEAGRSEALRSRMLRPEVQRPFIASDVPYTDFQRAASPPPRNYIPNQRRYYVTSVPVRRTIVSSPRCYGNRVIVRHRRRIIVYPTRYHRNW